MRSRSRSGKTNILPSLLADLVDHHNSANVRASCVNQNFVSDMCHQYEGPVTPHKTWFDVLAECSFGLMGGAAETAEAAPTSTVVRIGNVVTPEDLTDDDTQKEVFGISSALRYQLLCSVRTVPCVDDVALLGEWGFRFMILVQECISRLTKQDTRIALSSPYSRVRISLVELTLEIPFHSRGSIFRTLPLDFSVVLVAPRCAVAEARPFHAHINVHT